MSASSCSPRLVSRCVYRDDRRSRRDRACQDRRDRERERYYDYDDD